MAKGKPFITINVSSSGVDASQVSAAVRKIDTAMRRGARKGVAEASNEVCAMMRKYIENQLGDWPPLSANWLTMKKLYGHGSKILIASGAMVGSIGYELTNGGMGSIIGPKVPYAAAHEDGVKKKGRGTPIPQRAFVKPVGRLTKPMVVRTILKHVRAALSGVGKDPSLSHYQSVIGGTIASLERSAKRSLSQLLGSKTRGGMYRAAEVVRMSATGKVAAKRFVKSLDKTADSRGHRTFLRNAAFNEKLDEFVSSRRSAAEAGVKARELAAKHKAELAAARKQRRAAGSSGTEIKGAETKSISSNLEKSANRSLSGSEWSRRSREEKRAFVEELRQDSFWEFADERKGIYKRAVSTSTTYRNSEFFYKTRPNKWKP